MNDISARLGACEERITYNGVTGLRYWRAGAPNAPVLVFLPGGGHLARIAYGMDSLDWSQFLDHWLAQEGWGLLALSYPTDHPAIGVTSPEVTLAQWTGWVAKVTADVMQGAPERQVFAALWSMSGRSSNALHTAFRKQGRKLTGVVSLAAMPPLDGLMTVTPGGEPLTEEGLWAIGPTGALPHNVWVQSFLDDLAELSEREGRTVIPEETYLQDFLCNTPVMLRGTPQRICEGLATWDASAAQDDMRASDLDAFPLAAAIVPTDQADGRHVLVDAASWGFVNAQAIRARWHAAGAATAHWPEFVALSRQCRGSLLREVQGSHFFFVGTHGAQATAKAVIALAEELAQLDADIDRLLSA